MRKKENILFDLDGTLTDPKVGITKSVQKALAHFGIQPPPMESLLCFIGPPLLGSFMKYYGMSEAEAQEALAVYRAYFSVTGLFENEVYPGIESLLSDLKKTGKKVFLATSKPTVYAEQILEHFGLLQYFDYVSGSFLSGERVEKDQVITHVLEKFRLEREKTLMVGDRKFDIMGAKKSFLSSVGVLYGYGDKDELSEADALAESVSELRNIILG